MTAPTRLLCPDALDRPLEPLPHAARTVLAGDATTWVVTETLRKVYVAWSWC